MADQTLAAPPSRAPRVLRPRPRNLLLVVLRDVLIYLGEIAILLAQATRALVQQGVDLRDLLSQAATIGVNSLPVAMLTSLASGAVIALYFTPFLMSYGVGGFVGGVVAVALARELVPTLTGVVVAARAGSQIAAELGTMKVTEQIDALRALAVNPIQYLVVPRILAAVVMVPLVCIFSDAIGVYGGYIVAVYQEHLPAAMYTASIQQNLMPWDFIGGMIKTLVFGIIVVLVGCHQGLKTNGGATDVGRATTNSVVLSIVLIYIADYFLAYLMFQKASSY